MANMKRSACCATLMYVFTSCVQEEVWHGDLTSRPVHLSMCAWALGIGVELCCELSVIDISISFEHNTDTRCALAFEHTDLWADWSKYIATSCVCIALWYLRLNWRMYVPSLWADWCAYTRASCVLVWTELWILLTIPKKNYWSMNSVWMVWPQGKHVQLLGQQTSIHTRHFGAARESLEQPWVGWGNQTLTCLLYEIAFWYIHLEGIIRILPYNNGWYKTIITF